MFVNDLVAELGELSINTYLLHRRGGNSKMFCDHETAMFPEAHPMKTSPVEGSQHILPSRGPSR